MLRAVLLGFFAILMIVGNRVPRAHATVAVVAPTGLPNHLGIGVAAQPDNTGLYGWMPDSHITWDYAYQYLAGGVNTGSGWETWNSAGQFALNYAQGANADHAIPVFTYYELLQSSGTCNGCSEPQRDLSNLNDASVMSGYYQNFTLLMKRLGAGTRDTITGYGRTAIVQIEPDLSGFAEQAVLDPASHCFSLCIATGNDPANLRAQVGATGIPDLAGYADTYQGFNRALIHLRDLYAPNVLLGFHVSDWATTTDVGSSIDPALDVVAMGQEIGSFAAASGNFDLLFNDVADRDAGYYKYVLGNPTVWWDRTNTVFPNFHRWESYIAAVSQTANRKVFVWQIPLGNQYFDTENNSDGHYQDNRVEYFFSHTSELVQAGVIGLLFGAGNGGSTVLDDGKNDGPHDFAPICNGDGLAGGTICNTHAAISADEDGGYLRMVATQYYASGPTPAWVTRATVQRRAGALLFRWRVTNRSGILGFAVYAGSRRLDTLAVSVRNNGRYACRVRWAGDSGRFFLHVLFPRGGHTVLPITVLAP